MYPGSGFITIIIYHSFSSVVPGTGTALLAETGNELLTEGNDFIFIE